MKKRYWFAIAFGVVVAVIVAGGAVLLETQAGLRWAVGVAESHSGGVLRIGRVEGKLAGPITVKNLRLTLDDDTITAEHLELDWRPSALAAGKLAIVSLRGTGITVSIAAGEDHSPTVLPDRLDLPLHVTVAAAELHHLRIAAAGKTVRLERLDFALDAGDDAIRLSKLEARSPRFTLGGNLRLEPHGSWALDAELAETLRPSDYPVVAGRIRLDGALRRTVNVVQTLRAPFPVTLKAGITSVFDRPTVRGSLHISRAALQTINPDWPALQTTVDLNFSGTRKAFSAQGEVRLSGEHSGLIALHLEGGMETQRLRIAHLDLVLRKAGTASPAPSRADIAPARISLRGSIGLNEPYSGHLEVAWRDLRWPLDTAEPTLRAAAGGTRIDGNLNAWQLSALTLLQAASLPPGRWSLRARGDRKEITLTGLAGRWLDGRVAATGHVNLADHGKFGLALNAADLSLDALGERLRGRLGFVLSGSGTFDPLQTRVRITQLAGQLQGSKITGTADLAWANETLHVNMLRLAAGPNRFNASGRWGEQLTLDWALQAPELAALGFDLAGSLHAQGHISGPVAVPHVQGRLVGEQLRWQALHIGEARAEADISLAAAPSSLDVRVENLTRGRLELDTATLTLSGPAVAERFTLELSGNQGTVRLAGRGRFEQGIWRGTLTEGSLRPAQAPVFTLTAPAAMVLGAKKQRLDKNCWLGPHDARVCLAATFDQQAWRAGAELRDFPLAIGDPYFTGSLKLRGLLNGKLTAAGGNDNLDLLAELHVGQGSILRSIDGQKHRFGFTEAALVARANETTADLRLGVLPAAGGMLDLSASLPWRSHREPTGRLHLVARLPDLSGAGVLSEAIGNVSGRLDADFSVSGSLDVPKFSGHIRLAHAGFTLTRLGTHVENGNLELQGDGAALRLTGALTDGADGRLTLDGRLSGAANQWALAMRIEGNGFLIADMPQARVEVSPDLAISLEDRVLTVSGSVAVPSAHIKPPHFSNAITPSPDLVIVGTQKAQRQSPLKLAARVHISLGDDVHFEGYGLKARIDGELTLVEKPGELTTATGELTILEGHYKAYGQDLDIREGHLLFSGGPITNPALNIRATRQIGTVTAGLAVTGTLKTPHLRVFSNPPMSQSNALAYLLFGHGVQQNSGKENSLYSQAATAIGIAGGTYLVKSLGEQVGIDTVSVENASRYSTDSGQASLFLGKYLSPSLYVSYGIGLYEPINLLRIHYTLSRHWALEAESGSISGADILFTIEF